MAETIETADPPAKIARGRTGPVGSAPEGPPDCVITMDPRDRIVEFNSAAERTFGVRAQDVVGRDLADVLLPARLRESHREGLARYLATGEARLLNKPIVMPALRADGTEFPAEFAIARIETAAGPRFTVHLHAVSRTASSAGEGRHER